MTYQEIQDRLSKCESTLEQLKNGSVKPTEKITVKNLEVLKESLEKQLSEADKGIVYTDDEVKAKDLADKGANVKLTSEMKPGDEEDLERRRFNQLSRKDQNTLIAIKAMMDKEKAKNEAPDGPPISKMTRADMIDFLNTTPEKVKHMSDEELRDAAIDKNDDVRETEYDTTVSEQPADYPADLSEAVDPSITDLLVQFVTLMGMGYGVYQAAKKLSDKHGDINLDSIKAALSKKEDKEKDDYGRNHYPEKGEYIKLGDEEREAMKNNKLGIKENEIGDADDNVGMGYKNARDIINYLREKIYPYMDDSELQEFNDEMHTHFASNSSRFVKEGDDICSCCNNPIVNGSCGCPDDCPHCGGKGKVDEDDNPVPQGKHIKVDDMQFMYDSIVSRMKMLAKIYKEKGPEATVMLGPNNDKEVKVVDTLKLLTKKKRELEDALQNKVAGIGQDQELAEVNEDADDEHMVHELIGDLFAPGNARSHLDFSVEVIAKELEDHKEGLTRQGVKDAMDLYDKLAADGTLDKEVEDGDGFISSKHVPKLKKAFELIGLYGKGINESDAQRKAIYATKAEKEKK